LGEEGILKKNIKKTQVGKRPLPLKKKNNLFVRATKGPEERKQKVPPGGKRAMVRVQRRGGGVKKRWWR